MFSHDHSPNPRVPHPTAFDGVKPSFMEWSETIIAFLAVTDYQKFIPLLSAGSSSKDVIHKNIMFKGALSDLMEEINKNPKIWPKRKQIKQNFKPKIGLNKFRISAKKFKML